MRLSHILVFWLLVALTVSSFSAIDFSSSLDRFETLVEEYNAGESKFRKDFDHMAVYRQYRLAIMGGVKDDSFHFDVESLLEDIYEENLTKKPKENIALAAFLCYVDAKSFGHNFDLSALNEFPPFYKAFYQYIDNIKEEAIGYYSQWIGYAIGLVPDKPEGDFDIKRASSRLRTRMRLDYEKDEVFFSIIEENKNEQTEERLKTAVNDVKRDLRGEVDERRLERSIRKNALYVVSPFVEKLSDQQQTLAKDFISRTKKTFDWWLIRFFIYIALFLMLYKRKKILPWLLLLVVLFDSHYLIISEKLIYSDMQALIYGLLSIMIFGFAIILLLSRFVNKKTSNYFNFSNSILVIAVLLLYLIPIFQSPDVLEMDNVGEFYDSVSYDALKDELFGWEKAYLMLPFQDFVNGDTDVEETKERIQERIEVTLHYAGETLHSDIQEFLTSKVEEERFTQFTSVVKETLEGNPPEGEAPDVFMYNTVYGGVELLFITIIAAGIIIFKLGVVSLLMMYALQFYLLLSFVFQGSYHFIVEKGYPLLRNEVAGVNMLLIGAFLVLIIITMIMDIRKSSKMKHV